MVAFITVFAALIPAAFAARPLRLAAGSSPVPGPSGTPASSPNWNSYLLQKYPANTFKSISASFQVPEPRAPANYANYPRDQIYDASIWLGIDGAEADAQAAIAAIGVDLQLNLDADIPLGLSVWAEFYPSKGKQTLGSVYPGDVITLSITTTNATTAVFKYENFFARTSVSKTIVSTVPLVRKNLEIVASPNNGNPLADYGTIDFRRVDFGLINGTTLGPQLTDHTKYTMLVDATGKQITGAGASTNSIDLHSNFGTPGAC